MNVQSLTTEERQKLLEQLSAIDKAVTLPQLRKAVEEMLRFELSLKNKTETELKIIAESVKTALQRIETTASDNHTKTSEKLSTELEVMMNKMMLEHEAMMSECDAKMNDMKDGDPGEDGLDADEEEIIKKILPQLPKPKEPELTQEDKDELEQKIAELEKRLSGIRTAPFIGPSRGIFLKINGVKQGIVSELNIVGSGVALTTVNGLPTVTITGGSGVTAVETPAGAVDGSNTTYTATNTPLYIIVDGISKFPTLHYTFLAGTIEVTDGAPPVQYIRSVFSA